jgi:hypothetical protein
VLVVAISPQGGMVKIRDINKKSQNNLVNLDLIPKHVCVDLKVCGSNDQIKTQAAKTNICFFFNFSCIKKYLSKFSILFVSYSCLVLCYYLFIIILYDLFLVYSFVFLLFILFKFFYFGLFLVLVLIPIFLGLLGDPPVFCGG